MTDETKAPPDAQEDVVEELTSRLLSDEERYFYEQAYKEPVESMARIEEVAKFLVGAVATTSGLFAAAFKLVRGTQTVTGITWLVPFAFWALSIITLILVLLPQKYAVGKNTPADWRARFLQARDRKFRRLVIGALFFIAGIIAAIYPFAQWPGIGSSPGSAPQNRVFFTPMAIFMSWSYSPDSMPFAAWSSDWPSQ